MYPDNKSNKCQIYWLDYENKQYRTRQKETALSSAPTQGPQVPQEQIPRTAGSTSLSANVLGLSDIRQRPYTSA